MQAGPEEVVGLVKVESSEGITTITMARPEKRNALTQELCEDRKSVV